MLEGDDSEPALANLIVKDFIRAVGSRTSVPGGGSVAALIGSLVSCLLSCVYSGELCSLLCKL